MDGPPVNRTRGPGRASTARELQVLTFIANELAAHGQPPTVREIMGHLGSTSTSVGRYFVTKLVDKGMLRRVPWIPRGIEVTDLARETYPELFPLTPIEAVFAAVRDARNAGEALPARVVAVLEAVC